MDVTGEGDERNKGLRNMLLLLVPDCGFVVLAAVVIINSVFVPVFGVLVVAQRFC